MTSQLGPLGTSGSSQPAQRQAGSKRKRSQTRDLSPPLTPLSPSSSHSKRTETSTSAFELIESEDRVLGLHGVSTVSGTGVVSSPSANVTSAGLVSCAPRLSHTPPHDFHREVLASPMQPQAHQYYAPQYNPLHFPQQQQPRFDFTHPLEPAFPSQQFGNGPAGFHPSTGASHQSMAGPTHPQPVSQHQARHPLRGRPSEALQQAHINQFAGAAMEHARRREELYVRRPDHMFDIIAQGNIADAQNHRSGLSNKNGDSHNHHSARESKWDTKAKCNEKIKKKLF